jgi:hypothetical protein
MNFVEPNMIVGVYCLRQLKLRISFPNIQRELFDEYGRDLMRNDSDVGQP